MKSNVGTRESSTEQQIRQATTENVVIIGLNRIGLIVYNNPQRFLRPVEKVVGFVHVYPLEEIDNAEQYPNVLGHLSELGKVIEEHEVHKAIIAVDPHDVQKIHEVVQSCERNNVKYELISDLYDVVYGQTFKEILKDIQRPIEISFRRFFDLLVSLTMFLLFLPSWIIIAIAIKLDSPGTILYSQERVGKGGRIFRIFKFRSMRSDAEKYAGPQLATRNDPRITRVGRILRKTRLDELPQLINVIIGDMSLIGPRPERPYFVEKYKREIPFYVNRLKVKPGVTGLAQVETGYDESIEDVREKLKYDLYYIDHYDSLWLNLKILFKTVWVVLTAQGQ